MDPDELASDGEEQRANLSEDQARMNALGDTVRELLDVKRKIADAEAELKALEKEAFDIESKRLPQLFLEAGFIAGSKVKLPDGFEVTLKEDVAASITEKNKERAFAWLRANGFGDVIKNVVAITFGKGEDEKVEKLRGLLMENAFESEQKMSVHANTLKALTREQLIERGNPAFTSEEAKEVLGIYKYHKVAIKESK